jgi:hypothetical protein
MEEEIRARFENSQILRRGIDRWSARTTASTFLARSIREYASSSAPSARMASTSTRIAGMNGAARPAS